MERRFAGRTSSPFFLTGPAMVLVLAVALTGVAGPGAAASRAPAQLDTRPTPTAAQTGAIADLAEALDYDIERIFRFVADEIRYEPYLGILRGAQGTLDARAGNSVDQALLLAALLDESLALYRFARGPIDEAIAAELIDSISVDAAAARQSAEDAFADGLAPVARPPGGPLLELYEAGVRASVADARAQLESAESRLTETVAVIESSLDGAGIDLPADAPSLPPAELAEHTWVQVAQGPDWLDLDPTLLTSDPGAVLTVASETLDQLPDDLRHRVEFEVIVERASGGQLVSDAVVEHSAFADQIAGAPLVFGHITPTGAERLGITLANAFGDGQIEYRPFLDLGSSLLVADDAVVFGLAGGAGDGGLFEDTGLLDVPASSNDALGPSDGEAIAEWLTVRITQPGAEPVVARRTVFDRLPAALRHGGQVTLEAVEPVELVDLEGTGSSDFAPMLGATSFAIVTGPTDIPALVARYPDGLGMMALAYQGLRDAMAAGMGIDAGARTFVDGLNVVSFSLDPDVSGPDPSFRAGLDIWHRNHGVLPLAGPSASVAEAEIIAGVTGHLAERVALAGLASAQDPDLGPIGVDAVFEAAAQDGIPIVVLQGTAPDGLPYGPMANARIEEAIGSGHAIVIPAEPVTLDGRERAGWWRIDRATGTTRDEMDDGSGGLVEKLIPTSNALRSAACVASYASTIIGALSAVGLAMMLADPEHGLAWAALADLSLGGAGILAAVVCTAKAPVPPPRPPLNAIPPYVRPQMPPPLPFPTMPRFPPPRGPTGTDPMGWVF